MAPSGSWSRSITHNKSKMQKTPSMVSSHRLETAFDTCQIPEALPVAPGAVPAGRRRVGAPPQQEEHLGQIRQRIFNRGTVESGCGELQSRFLEDLLVERGVQGGVPEPVPVQVPGVVVLQGPRTVLQRVLLDDSDGVHLDAAGDQGRIAVEKSAGQAQARRPIQNAQAASSGLTMMTNSRLQASPLGTSLFYHFLR
jgi:hypothetical protein